MIAIKNMEIPSSCAECPMTYKDEVDYRICTIIGKNIDYGNPNEVHPDCPLTKIITCKDCRHYCIDEDGRGYHCECINNIRFPVHKDFYCENAEVKDR